MLPPSKPILYYYPGSAPVRTVLLVAKAINLVLDLKLVDLLRGEQLESWYTNLNPLHQVPLLVDEIHIIMESHAICTYLIGKYGGEDNALYPRDLHARSRIDQRMYFNNGQVYPAAANIVKAILNDGATGPSPDQLQYAIQTYAVLEKFLATDLYMAGAQPTLADLALSTSVSQLNGTVPLVEYTYPKISAWLARLGELPYYHEANTLLLADFMKKLEGKLQKNRE